MFVSVDFLCSRPPPSSPLPHLYLALRVHPPLVVTSHSSISVKWKTSVGQIIQRKHSQTPYNIGCELRVRAKGRKGQQKKNTRISGMKQSIKLVSCGDGWQRKYNEKARTSTTK